MGRPSVYDQGVGSSSVDVESTSLDATYGIGRDGRI